MASFVTTLASHPIIVLFLLANLAIGFWAHSKSKSNSFEDYALASRSLPTGVLVMTLLGTLLDTGILHHPGNVFGTYGLLQCGAIIAYMISFCFIGTFIAPFLVYFDGSLTVGDLMEKMYGPTVRIPTGIVSCIVCLLMISPQLQAISKVIHYLLEIPVAYTIIVLGMLVVLYSFFGGMRSVSYTDVLQVVAIIITVIWIAHTVLQKVGGVQNVLAKLPDDKMRIMSHPKFTYRLKAWTFWRLVPSFLLTPPVIQRMLIVRDKRQVRSMWYLSAFLYSLIVFVFICIGLGAIVGNIEFKLNSDSTELLPRLIKTLFAHQPWTVELLALGFIAVALSTIDSYLHAVGVTVAQDILEPLSKRLKIRGHAPYKKTTYARLGIICIGFFAVLMAFVQGGIFFNREAFQVVVVIYTLIVIPLIIGVVGIKTDSTSLISFALIYLVALGYLKQQVWHIYGSFLVALPLGIIAYFLTHIYINGGIVTLKRSKQTIAEQLWIPTWGGAFEYIKSWFLAPFNLHILASRKIVSKPTHSLSFSMLIFLLYTFSSVMTGGGNDLGLANFMAGIHMIGVTLCVGLMLEGIWAARLKPYFALYWFFTVFYCLSFGSTLAFLRSHGDTMAVIKWMVNFILLAFLIDSMSFITLSCLGSGLAMASWYVVFGGLPSDLLGSVGLPGGYFLFGLLVAVLLFESSREQYSSQRLDWNRTASGILGHDLRLTVQMLNGVGNVLNNTFKTAESITNSQGKQGYWIEKEQTKFLDGFGTKLIEKSKEARDDIKRFIDFMEQQVMGWLEQEKVSMHKVAQDVIHKMEDKYASSMEMTISCQKDFEANVFSVFPNVIANLLKNASKHGKATKFDIKIDGEKRTLVVRDNGKGIPSDVLPHIFDLNFSTADKPDENSGVGLAFVKMVVSASSGKVSCCSRHGDKDSFTEFVMEFPQV